MRRDGVYPGLAASGDVVVEWGGRLRVPMRATVRHVSADRDGEGELAGVELEPPTPEEAAVWAEELEPLLFPRTSASGTWARPLWHLFEASGYFQLIGQVRR